MTQNAGLLPVSLGPARLQQSEHTLVHYFELSQINSKIQNLNDHYQNLQQMINKNDKVNNEINNYDRIFRHFYSTVRDKLNNIYPNGQIRSKRGLIDGLGSAIKFITGNMDANDAARINKIVQNLEKGHDKLQQQIDNQYSISNNILAQFNATIKNVHFNEVLLKTKIMKMNEEIQNTTREINILELKDLFNQLILVYTTILNLITDIENSLTFCAAGIMHPSIIKVHDLMSELTNLVPYYQDQLPFPVKTENILNYQSIIKIHCRHKGDKIIYFLTIPIEYNTSFELYYLESLPMQIENEYLTIIPNFKYLLKNQNFVKPLLDKCVTNGIYHHCPSNIVLDGNTTCESNILQGKSIDDCSYTRINNVHDQLQALPFTNKYLGCFSKESTMDVHCKNERKILRPKGIFLMEISEDCQVNFNGKVFKAIGPSHFTPIMVDFQMPQQRMLLKRTNMSIDLKALTLSKMNFQHLHPIEITENGRKIYVPSIWTIMIYFGIIITIGIIVKRKFRKNSTQHPTTVVQVDANPRSLPSEASF